MPSPIPASIDATVELLQGGDSAEGVKAYAEKRDARFTGS